MEEGYSECAICYRKVLLEDCDECGLCGEDPICPYCQCDCQDDDE